MEDYRAIIGENIRRQRKRRHMTQEDLADLTGMQPSCVGKIERAQANPNLNTLLRVADALEVDLPELLAAPSSERMNGYLHNVYLPALPEPNRSAARALLQILNDVVNIELDSSYVQSLVAQVLRLIRHSFYEVISSRCQDTMYRGLRVYGIKATFYAMGRAERVKVIPDLSTDRNAVERFVAQLNRNFVSYDNFMDLLEDFMGGDEW